MNYKLITNSCNQVGYYIRSDKRLFHDLMSADTAKLIISGGTVEITDTVKGFPVCVDGKYFFEAIQSEDSL